ncbi:MAG: hypothetical protein GOV15_04450 [Candidatus Diapherotrites archaeon]|nr:hypothetical protein [Candidatus Diapherotrites archaeon]
MAKKKGIKINSGWIKTSVIGGIVYGIIATSMMFLLGFIQNIAGLNLMPFYYGPAFLPMTAMSSMFAVPFIAGIIYALVYGVIRPAIPGRKLEKGLVYGFIIWAVATIPGMLMTATSFNVPIVLIVDWTFTNLASLVTGGVAIAWFYGDK